MTKTKYISYLRVSTDRQGKSGLGLEAQRKAVTDYIASGNAQLISEVLEVESGKLSDRPKLAEALALCKVHRARLIIAKIDRLARNVAFISNLMESGVDFLAVDMPEANKLTIHIIAAMAEYEREMISVRTKVALSAAKARGKKLGGFRGRSGTSADTAKARAARANKSIEHAKSLGALLKGMQGLSLNQIAAKFNDDSIPTPSGVGRWNASTIQRIKQKILI